MYEFHYKYIGLKYGSSAKLLFTDTGSLVYEIKTDDVSEDFYGNTTLFDFSDYPKASGFYDPVNEKVIGKMKDEVNGKIISEFIGLKSKIYALVIVENEGIKKTKSVNKSVVKSIRYKEYVDVLDSRGLVRHEMKRIQTKLRRIWDLWFLQNLFLSF